MSYESKARKVALLERIKRGAEKRIGHKLRPREKAPLVQPYRVKT